MCELVRLFNACAESTTLEPIAVTAAMMEGKVRAALRLDLKTGDSPPLVLDEAVVPNGGTHTVRDILKQKHPEGKQITPSAIVSDPIPNELHPVIFDHITGSLVRSMALRTEGAAG